MVFTEISKNQMGTVLSVISNIRVAIEGLVFRVMEMTDIL